MTIGEQLKGKGVVFSECDIYKKNKNEQLFNAIKNRNYYKIRQLLNSGVDVNSRDSYGYTPLMTAIEYNDIKICRLLVEYGAEINCKDNDGETSLIKAVLTGSKTITEFIIKNGVNLDETDGFGETALMKAAWCDSNEIGNLLLMENAEYNKKNGEGKTARDIAIKKWGSKREDFFLREPLTDKNLLIKKSAYLIHNIIANKKVGFAVSISEVNKKIEKKYNERIDNETIEKKSRFIK